MADNIETPTSADSVSVINTAGGDNVSKWVTSAQTDSITFKESTNVLKTAEKALPALKYVETVVPVKAPNIRVATIVRSAAVLVTLLNTVLVTLHKNPIPYTSDQVYDTLSIVAVAGASLWAAWKNNSFTKAARQSEVAGKAALIKVEADNLSSK